MHRKPFGMARLPTRGRAECLKTEAAKDFNAPRTKTAKRGPEPQLYHAYASAATGLLL